jgi:exopolyphosphatase/guanosine-5'-triphosphate,3'-diphosphate pyrophosphatase
MGGTPSAEQPIGVISMGSNDLHLLVATSDGRSHFAVQADHSLLIELAANLDGHLLPAVALSRALTGVNTLMQAARAAGARTVTALGTEALREAANGPALLALLAATFGITATIITGEQEAVLDYRWALFPPAADAPQTGHQRRLVIDSGGGSTQVVLGADSAPAWSTSLPIGAGSLTAQLVAHDPPKSKEIHTLTTHVAALVDPLPRSLTPEFAVALGGSADHLLALGAHPHRGILTRTDLEQAVALLQNKPAAKVAREHDMPVERARLLPAGALILLRILEHYAIDAAQVKPHGIRGGFIVCTARADDQWLRAAMP